MPIKSRYEEEDLYQKIFIDNLSYQAIGRFYGVSGNAIIKACKRLGIILPVKRKVNVTESFNKTKTILAGVNNADFINIIEESEGWIEILTKLGYSPLGYKIRASVLKRCNQLNLKPNTKEPSIILKVTKGDLFSKRKNWQSASSSIRRLARDKFYRYNPNPTCKICGYSTCVQVAHLKPVSSFSSDTPISIINDISNLVGLCPNHHWEFDNGHINFNLL